MKYSIGLDFGTLSVRAVVVSTETGVIAGSDVRKYESGIIDDFLFEEKLPKDYALQNADDYVAAMNRAVTNAIEKSQVCKADIVGIGIDFTSSTILPMKSDGTPLSRIDKYKRNKHAYVKLWKHHGAETEAKLITRIARERSESWLKRYGGIISSEWMLPKILEIINDDLPLYNEIDYFIEAGDYISFILTGNLVRSSCQAGYKSLWHNTNGYPSNDYLQAVHSELNNLYETKLAGEVKGIGQSQGVLKQEFQNMFGLQNINVAVSVIDAHVAAPACQVVNSGDFLMILGTSSCDILLQDQEIEVKGISGVVKSGAVPNLYAYESGQPAVGDMFSWFMENGVPKSYYEEADTKKISIYEYLESKIYDIPENKAPLLCLDWWNGNRSILVDPDLSGMIIGLNLQTKPEEIYKALIQATAFGKKRIFNRYIESGVKIERVVACGGLVVKNKYLMQTYSDILEYPIYVTDQEFAPAIGASIFGYMASKHSRKIKHIVDISKSMGHLNEIPYLPRFSKDTQEIYKLYLEMYNYFGLENDIMKRLRKLS
jgi:L-ribulokinase